MQLKPVCLEAQQQLQATFDQMTLGLKLGLQVIFALQWSAVPLSP